MSQFQYDAVEDVQGGLKVMADWLTDSQDLTVQWVKDGTPCADIKNKIIQIPQINGLNDENLMKVRGFFYHEGGHILESDIDMASIKENSKKMILNALEDYRIEEKLSQKHDGCRVIFNKMAEHFNKVVGGQVEEGKTEGRELWEGLVGMGFMTKGLSLAWSPSEKAKKYIDECYGDFQEVRCACNTADCLLIAERIYEKIKEMKKQEKEQQKKEDKKNEKKQDGQQGKQGDKSDSNDKSEKQDNKSGEENKSEEQQQPGMSEDDDDESDSENNENNKSEEQDDNNSEDKPEKNKNENEENNKTEEQDKSENNEQENDKSEEQDESEGEGKSDEQPEEKDNSENESEEGQNEELTKKELKEIEKAIAKEMEKESQGQNLIDALQKEIEKAIKELPPVDKRYSSVKEADIVTIPKTDSMSMHKYNVIREQVSSAITGMTQCLDQAFRTMAQSKKLPYQQRGKLDMKRLVPIAKNLDRRVFFTKTTGIKMDTCVEIIVDLSGSMRHYIDQVRPMVIALAETLDRLHVPFEIFGSSTKYSGGDTRLPELNGFDRVNPIVTHIYKTFSEGYVGVRERLGEMTTHKHFIDGEMIDMAARRIGKREESRKIIIVINDGRPEAGHGNENIMAQNLKDMVKKVRKSGIEVYGFGIGTDGPRAYYGAEHFIYLKNLSELGYDFFKGFAEIITAGRMLTKFAC